MIIRGTSYEHVFLFMVMTITSYEHLFIFMILRGTSYENLFIFMITGTSYEHLFLFMIMTVTSYEHLFIFMISRWMFLRKMEMLQRRFTEKIKTSILCPINLQTGNRAVCEINVEKYCTAGQPIDGRTIRHDRFVCLISEATNLHWDIYCFCSAKIVARKSHNVTL